MRLILSGMISLSLMSCAGAPPVPPVRPNGPPIWHPGIVSLPTVIEMPTLETLATHHPRNTGGADLPGYADLRCVTKTDGSLGECSIISERPAEQGFGRAALNVTPHIRVVPRLDDGAATEGTIVLHIEFTDSEGRAPSASPRP